MITTLIDKQDNSELIRDQIAAILATEIANQQILAEADGQDPDDWKLRVYAERTNPWEEFLEDNPDDVSPIVNVWYESSSFTKGKSDAIKRQFTTGSFNIDCYGYGVSEQDDDGQKVGDQEAAYEVQKAVRLVRNILMAGDYTRLGLRGLVWDRWIQSTTNFQLPSGEDAIQNVMAARVSFDVDFNELSPQYEPETLSSIAINVKREEDGEIVAQLDYDYTE